MSKPNLKINVRLTNYKGLALLARKVLALMTGNLLFPTPNPTLVTITTDVTALENANGNAGTRQNRGSKAERAALMSAAKAVKNDLTLLAAYVANTVDNTTPDAIRLNELLSSGFDVKNQPSKLPIFGPVQKLHIQVKKTVVEPNVSLKWKKPEQLLQGTRIRAYNVYKNNVFLLSLTRTTLVVARPAGIADDIYTISAVNDIGEGAINAIVVHGRGV